MENGTVNFSMFCHKFLLQKLDTVFEPIFSNTFQNIYFSTILSTLVSFLTTNPSEFILLKIKQEYTAAQNTKGFWEIYSSYVNTTLVQNFIWSPTTENPPISQLRGKIIILDDYTAIPSNSLKLTKFGLPWKNGGLFDSQNFYDLHTQFEMVKKWKQIKGQLMKAEENWKRSEKNAIYFVNHLSGNGDLSGVFPYFVASDI
jgi:1-phosphatidylinositol phosphodiesterase